MKIAFQEINKLGAIYITTPYVFADFVTLTIVINSILFQLLQAETYRFVPKLLPHRPIKYTGEISECTVYLNR